MLSAFWTIRMTSSRNCSIWLRHTRLLIRLLICIANTRIFHEPARKKEQKISINFAIINQENLELFELFVFNSFRIIFLWILNFVIFWRFVENHRDSSNLFCVLYCLLVCSVLVWVWRNLHSIFDVGFNRDICSMHYSFYMCLQFPKNVLVLFSSFFRCFFKFELEKGSLPSSRVSWIFIL